MIRFTISSPADAEADLTPAPAESNDDMVMNVSMRE